MRPLVLGVGTGRSGTRWLAQTLRHSGIPIAHEKHFGRYMRPPAGAAWDLDLMGEVSLNAAPYVEHYPDTLVVHQVRHPLTCIASIARFGFWDMDRADTRSLTLSRFFNPVQDDVLLDSARYWMRWNTMCEQTTGPYLRIQLEEVGVRTVQMICAWCGVAPLPDARVQEIIDGTPRPTEMGGNTSPISWEDLGPLRDQVMAMAIGYGYSLDLT